MEFDALWWTHYFLPLEKRPQHGAWTLFYFCCLHCETRCIFVSWNIAGLYDSLFLFFFFMILLVNNRILIFLLYIKTESIKFNVKFKIIIVPFAQYFRIEIKPIWNTKFIIYFYTVWSIELGMYYITRTISFFFLFFFFFI